MPLFGLRTKKKNEQGHIETSADAAKTAAAKKGRPSKVDSKEVSKKAVLIKERETAVATANRVAMPSGIFSSVTEAVIRPHITEKSGNLSQKGVYTFQVAEHANKPSVAKAIKALYKVTPIKIGMINIPRKNIFMRGKKGTVPGMRKAVVTVKRGEKIDFV